MSNNNLALDAEFEKKVNGIITNCEELNIEMRLFESIRNPFIQAIYWKRSRTSKEISEQIANFKQQHAYFLAFCIEVVGPRYGSHNTNALPGYSWHQWGEAADLVWIVDQKIVWDTDLLIDEVNGYQIYAEQAKIFGLNAGYYWELFRDSPHVQLRKTGSPIELYSINEIDIEMQTRFGYLVDMGGFFTNLSKP